LRSRSLAEIRCGFCPLDCWDSSFLKSCKEVGLATGLRPRSPAQLCRRVPCCWLDEVRSDEVRSGGSDGFLGVVLDLAAAAARSVGLLDFRECDALADSDCGLADFLFEL